ncbi:MAG: ArnT family glycosyltransferase, partial [Bryobacteraceae bacterium]
VLWSGCLIYGIGAGVLIGWHIHHYGLAVIALQIFIFLPAVVYTLRFQRTEAVTPSALHFRPAASPYVLPFLAVMLATGYVVAHGVLEPDASAYRFQATIFANGELSAPAPPGAVNTPDTQLPIDFTHHIVDNGRWFSKYPVGWPAVLAIPEKLHFGWAAAPLLGALLLVIAGWIAREAFGAAAVAPSLWIAVLSPYWLATCVAVLSDALCAVLVAGACLYCLRALRGRSVRNFALMYAFLVPAFLVRPYTALVASVVYGIAALLWSWRNRSLFVRVASISVLAGAAAIALVLLFNFVYTGSALLSPYALYKGRAVPNEITASPTLILENLVHGWRFTAQSVLVFSFPLVFVLAAYGLWSQRRSWQAWLLALLFPALVVAYLADSGGPSSVVGERYWFEGFFGIAILAGQGLLALSSAWRPSRRLVVFGIAAVTCAQICLTVAAIQVLDSRARPYAVVRAAAQKFHHCHCAVFIGDSPPDFYSRNMDLNTAQWQNASVFYFNDPGPAQRQKWATLYGWQSWAVIAYDPQTQSARLYSPAGRRIKSY